MVLKLEDAHQRAAVAAAFTGPGKPAGVHECSVAGDELIIRLDAAITPPSLVRHLAEIELRRPSSSPAGLDDAALARLVAAAIRDPELDEGRILEVRVPELDR